MWTALLASVFHRNLVPTYPSLKFLPLLLRDTALPGNVLPWKRCKILRIFNKVNVRNMLNKPNIESHIVKIFHFSLSAFHFLYFFLDSTTVSGSSQSESAITNWFRKMNPDHRGMIGTCLKVLLVLEPRKRMKRKGVVLNFSTTEAEHMKIWTTNSFVKLENQLYLLVNFYSKIMYG